MWGRLKELALSTHFLPFFLAFQALLYSKKAMLPHGGGRGSKLACVPIMKASAM